MKSWSVDTKIVTAIEQYFPVWRCFFYAAEGGTQTRNPSQRYDNSNEAGHALLSTSVLCF